ncbi:hypothetical protein LCGC14_2013020, partial [marine sediment metagenome]
MDDDGAMMPRGDAMGQVVYGAHGLVQPGGRWDRRSRLVCLLGAVLGLSWVAGAEEDLGQVYRMTVLGPYSICRTREVRKGWGAVFLAKRDRSGLELVVADVHGFAVHEDIIFGTAGRQYFVMGTSEVGVYVRHQPRLFDSRQEWREYLSEQGVSEDVELLDPDEAAASRPAGT